MRDLEGALFERGVEQGRAAAVPLKASRAVHTVPLTDPNLHAGVDALIDAISLSAPWVYS